MRGESHRAHAIGCRSGAVRLVERTGEYFFYPIPNKNDSSRQLVVAQPCASIDMSAVMNLAASARAPVTGEWRKCDSEFTRSRAGQASRGIFLSTRTWIALRVCFSPPSRSFVLACTGMKNLFFNTRFPSLLFLQSSATFAPSPPRLSSLLCVRPPTQMMFPAP